MVVHPLDAKLPVRQSGTGPSGDCRRKLATPGMEDYLERIYLHIEAKGVARVSDVAESLAVFPVVCHENGAAA